MWAGEAERKVYGGYETGKTGEQRREEDLSGDITSKQRFGARNEQRVYRVGKKKYIHTYTYIYTISSLQTMQVQPKSTKNKKSEQLEIPHLDIIAITIWQTSCQMSPHFQPQKMI